LTTLFCKSVTICSKDIQGLAFHSSQLKKPLSFCGHVGLHGLKGRGQENCLQVYWH
jgi:hypothetical protein